jgi:hypothetical protein
MLDARPGCPVRRRRRERGVLRTGSANDLLSAADPLILSDRPPDDWSLLAIHGPHNPLQILAFLPPNPSLFKRHACYEGS